MKNPIIRNGYILIHSVRNTQTEEIIEACAHTHSYRRLMNIMMEMSGTLPRHLIKRSYWRKIEELW